MSLKYKILFSALFRNLNNEVELSNLRFYRNAISNEIFVLFLDANWQVNNNVCSKTVNGVIEPISNSRLCIFPQIKDFYSSQFGFYSKYDDISLLEKYLEETTFSFGEKNTSVDSNYDFFYKGDFYQEIPEAFLNIDKENSQTIKLKDIYKLYKRLNEENIFGDNIRKGK